MFPRIELLNVFIDNFTFNEAINEIVEIVKQRKIAYCVTPNVDHLINLQKDSLFLKIYKNAALVLPDGMPLIWAARFLGTPFKEKISGSDLFPKLCEKASLCGFKLFFLGGRPESASLSADILRRKYPGIQIVGTYSPPFGFENNKEENLKIINLIKSSNADIIFVGLGAPKQEKWIYAYYKELQVPFCIGIGVTFEFFSGLVKRAPVWMQSLGLEWFWRLIMEPKRLWKRYLVNDMPFFVFILKQKFRRFES